MKYCNEGRHWFWVLLWDLHSFEKVSTYVYPGGYGEALITEKCRKCGYVGSYDTPGGP